MASEKSFHQGEFIIPQNYMHVDMSSGIISMLKEIDWTEPWIICLMVFHLALTTLVLFTRRFSNVQFVLFGVLLILVYGAQNINKYCAEHWKSFSNQQYFDSNGLFVSIVFSCPLLINCIVMIGHWLWTSAIMMRSLRLRIRQRELSVSANKKKED